MKHLVLSELDISFQKEIINLYQSGYSLNDVRRNLILRGIHTSDSNIHKFLLRNKVKTRNRDEARAVQKLLRPVVVANLGKYAHIK